MSTYEIEFLQVEHVECLTSHYTYEPITIKRLSAIDVFCSLNFNINHMLSRFLQKEDLIVEETIWFS